MSVTVYATVSKHLLSEAQHDKVVSLVLRHLRKPHIDVSVHAVGDTRIRTLNKQYRGKDKATDVLSFPTDDLSSGDAGDIFISIPYIIKQAREVGVSAKEEYVRMLIHGVLHLFGYDHITKEEAAIMFGKQEKLVADAIRTCI